MTRIFKYLIFVCAFLFCVSCMEYDMSYPRVVAQFVKFDVEGARSVEIDAQNLTISIELEETVDIANVKINGYELAENVKFKKEELPQTLDLTSPYKVMLTLYQDYRWTISAVQPVERYIKCANQVGVAYFMEQSNEAFVYVSKSQRLKFLEINDMKLGLLGSTILPATENSSEPYTFPLTLDFTNTREFLVASKGDTTTWKVTAVPVEVPASITGVAPWCWSADVYATFDGVSDAPVIEYRHATDDAEWITIPADSVVVDGVNVSAHIGGLEPANQYELRLLFKDEYLPGESFTTDTPDQLPNFGFDDWWMSNKTWWVYGENYSPEDRVWDSANAGTGSLIGMNLTVPEESDVISGKALKMQSKYVMVKFAAGNLFTGKFNGLVGMTGADLDWGTPFTSKPKALKGHFKYEPALVNYIDNEVVTSPSQYDECQIQVVLIDTENPFKVLPMGGVNGPTYDGQMVDLSNSPYVVARGVQNYGGTEGKWVEFELPIDYVDPTRKPTYVIVTCASSYLGDFFTGGDGSTMIVDEFEFIYE